MLHATSPNRSGNVLGVGETKYMLVYSRKNDTPIAVISTDIFGAFLSGLYAIRSMSTPSMPVTTIAAIIAAQSGNPANVTAKNPVYAPTI